MLKIILPTILLVPMVWLVSSRWLWPWMQLHGLVIALISLSWCKPSFFLGWIFLGPFTGADPVSAPLLILSCWLFPLMLLASQYHLSVEPDFRQRMFICLTSLLQLFIVLAFAATEFLMFFIMFEATLIPTLFLIMRWGNQPERVYAGMYFLFYTLAGSLPLLIALLYMQDYMGSMSLLITPFSKAMMFTPIASKFWWGACMLAFLVKLPLYGVHLWLPKAHVEAPVAGSMVLAAILLKLGGYGMIRMMSLLQPLTHELMYPFIALALWGVLMASSVCLRHTDLKALIAYSSVSHMGLVIAAILTQTPWGLTGAMILMIAHGLTSSALFCLANTNYERTHSRVLFLARGLHMALPVMTVWWFISSLANLALPPLPNLMGELVIMVALIKWSKWTLIFTGLGTLITACYSLFMYSTTQRGPLTTHMISLAPTQSREHLLLALHIVPLLLLMTHPYLIWSLIN
uniref:NADH-ubiquinone oxidoreductase chain 4 n=1 Tax=Acanthaphritis unoorum TaxID=270607 RepID=A0A1V1FNW5_9TELE|nr:NADH dehydrogenase subunit 4 [Acanthaphritis unoorum]BAX03899.1 NADH dehydrogenase subunit 4 [Acanthaphritis unoorum]BBU26081.1 NADH dehydrogenase subunit 4 [Acanthaphritis unoorum]